MLAWNATEDCYQKALKAQREAECPIPWWFWIAATLTAGASIFQRQKRKRGKR
jgi:hypothetical protein